MIPREGSRLLLRAARVARDPMAAWERFFDRTERKIEYALPAPVYRAEPDWERRLHEMLGRDYPCPAMTEFQELWPKIAALVAAKGVRFGPESFGGWNDGDPKFVGAIWCLVRHLESENVVETGVAHGVSSRLILEALKRNGRGQLWSIDPPPVEAASAAEIGIAVDGFAPERWHLLRGTSRRLLPGLLTRLGQVDLFVHDSLHTRRNVCFEVAHVMPFLKPGGFVVIDDIDTNWGFHALMQQRPSDHFMVCESEPVRPDLRRFNDRGLFGIIRPAVIEPRRTTPPR